MEIETIRQLIREDRFFESQHAKHERDNDDLTLAEVTEAILSGKILEAYADTGRGKSCLVAGLVGEKPIHIVCAQSRFAPGQLVLVTVYIPKPPKFIDPWTRNLK